MFSLIASLIAIVFSISILTWVFIESGRGPKEQPRGESPKGRPDPSYRKDYR